MRLALVFLGSLILVCTRTDAQTPGGVTGSVFWVRADAGVTGTTNVSQWDDQSGNNNHAVQGTPGNQPSLLTNVLNFNPAIDFTDASDVMSLTTPPANLNTTFFAVGIPRANTFYRTLFRGTVNDHPLLMDVGTNNVGYWDNDNVGFKSAGFTWAQSEPAVFGVEMAASSVIFRKNGTDGTAITTINLAGLNLNYLGNYQAGGQRFGSIAEVIVFPTASLVAADKNKIETYMAIKYGLTIGHDYVASDGTVVWNLAANVPYSSNITGIAHDGALDKQMSLSANSTGAATLDKGAPLNDTEFILVGDNGLTGQSTDVSSFVRRSAKIWKAAVRGTPGTITLSVNLQSIAFPNTLVAGNYALLVDADATFSTGATVHATGASIVGNTINFNNVTLAHDQYYAVAVTSVISPGGVAGAVFWVKGDVGVTGSPDVSQWDDQSGVYNHATQNIGAAQPNLVTNSINGHNVVNFTASAEVMNITSPPPNLNSTIFAVGAPMVNTNYRTMFRGLEDHPILVEAGTTRLGYYDNGGAGFYSSGFSWAENEVAVVGLEMFTGDVNFRKNGAQGSSIGAIDLSAPTLVYLGNITTQPFGRISEAIVFNTPTELTVTEKQQIESYLAVKHGVTLTHDYLASDGVVIWDVAANSAYNSNIAGIGRDDASALDQQQSTTSHVTGGVTMNKGGAFSTDKDFLLWGHSTATGTSSNVPGGFIVRSNKIWRASVRGTPGAVSFSVNLVTIGVPNTGNAADYSLLIDTNTDFSTVSSTHNAGVALVGDVLSFTGLTLAHNNFFAIGSANATLPGGVAGMNIWLKANGGPEEGVGNPAESGDQITRWLDQSGNAFHYTGTSSTTLQDATFNFNPSVEVTTGGFDAPVGSELSTDWTVFFVSRKLASDDNGRVFDGHTGNFLWAHWGNYTNSIYIDGSPSNYNSGIATTVGIQNIHLHAYRRTAATGAIEARADGTTLSTFSGTNSAAGIRIDINRGAFSGESSHSRIGEMITFTSPLTPSEVEKVESYLSIKYGITVPHNYVSSDGTILWNASTNATYHNNVTGIGRDDATALDQRQSLSVNLGAAVTLSKGGAFTSNKDFLLWGNSATGGTSTNVPGTYEMRTGRIWRVATTGAPGAASFSANLLALGLFNTGNAADYALLIDTDTDFSDASIHVTGAALVGNTLSFTGVNLPNNSYFAVAADNVTGLGGVLVWLKANSGPEEAAGNPAESGDVLTSWQDQSGNGLHYVAAATTTLQDNTLNFNPSVEITTGGFDAPAGAELSTDWTLFFVSHKLASDNNGRLFEGHTGNYLWGYHTTYRNAIYLEGQPSNYNSGIATTAGIENLHLHTYKRASATGDLEARADGSSLATFGGTNSASGIRIDINRGMYFSTEPSHSRIGEMIMFNTPLSATDTDLVETYLGVKYGLTLAHNYITSDATVVWNSTTNAVYHNDVAGIGRDDFTGLDQRVSLGINSTAAVTMTHAGVFTTNKSYLVWGSNNLSGTSANVPTGYAVRTSKVWKVGLSGSPGTNNISINLTALGFTSTGNVADYALLIDTDADFSSGATAHTTGANLAAGVLSFTGVNFAHNDFFAIAYNFPVPGGIPGVVFWVIGDLAPGGAVGTWADQSGTANDAVQGTPANQPDKVTNDINGHATVDFSGTNDVFTLTSPPPALASMIFTVAVPNVLANWRTMFRSAAGDHHLIIEQLSNRLGYYDPDGGAFRDGGLTWAVGEIALVGEEMRATGVNFRKNGTQSGVNLTGTTLAGQPLTYFGNYQLGGQPFGRIAETMVYNTPTALTTAQKENIESYLAVKYGITVNHNYVSSDGTIIWNSTTNSAYHNEVAGVARDDNSSLDQQVSKSVVTGSVVTVDKGGAFGVDKTFLIWGNNTGAMDATGVTDYPASEGIVRRLARVWKVESANSPGAVSISFDLTSVPGSKTAGHLRLLIDRNLDGNFADETVGGGGIISGAADLGSNVFQFAGVTFNDTELFTIGSSDIGTPLPITLLSLRATPEFGTIRLDWSTATEINSELFTIQRTSGTEEFEDIAEIKGAGNSHKQINYSFVDTSPLQGRSYYRLRQSDFDGKQTFSRVVAVNIDLPFVLSPNPASEEFTIHGEGMDKATFRLINTLGQQVKPNSIVTQTNSVTFNVSDLAPGIYFISVQTERGLSSTKVVIE